MSNHIVIEQYRKYKFFFVETTANCNLRCKYCYFEKVDKTPKYSVDELVGSINRFDKIILCFLGGEPFLNCEFMEKIMEHPKLKDKDVIFASNTNGTQLHKMKREFLSRFTFHHLSIDGDQTNNDYFRGKGVFKKILENMKYLRTLSDAGVIARMSVSNPNQILDIPSFVDKFDAVYWQLNNTKSSLPEDFLDLYKKNLTKLFDFWKSIYEKKKYFTFIPIIGMCDLILINGMSDPDLICGAGTNHLNVCVDGSVYPCPESPHRLNDKERLGDIKNFDFKTYPLKDRCKVCNILRYCGGRCAMTNDELYCEAIRHLYNLTRDFIANLNERELCTLKEMVDYQKDLACTTEIIP